MSFWQTSGGYRLKAKQKQSVAHRQRRNNHRASIPFPTVPNYQPQPKRGGRSAGLNAGCSSAAADPIRRRAIAVQPDTNDTPIQPAQRRRIRNASQPYYYPRQHQQPPITSNHRMEPVVGRQEAYYDDEPGYQQQPNQYVLQQSYQPPERSFEAAWGDGRQTWRPVYQSPPLRPPQVVSAVEYRYAHQGHGPPPSYGPHSSYRDPAGDDFLDFFPPEEAPSEHFPSNEEHFVGPQHAHGRHFQVSPIDPGAHRQAFGFQSTRPYQPVSQGHASFMGHPEPPNAELYHSSASNMASSAPLFHQHEDTNMSALRQPSFSPSSSSAPLPHFHQAAAGPIRTRPSSFPGRTSELAGPEPYGYSDFFEDRQDAEHVDRMQVEQPESPHTVASFRQTADVQGNENCFARFRNRAPPPTTTAQAGAPQIQDFSSQLPGAQWSQQVPHAAPTAIGISGTVQTSVASRDPPPSLVGEQRLAVNNPTFTTAQFQATVATGTISTSSDDQAGQGSAIAVAESPPTDQDPAPVPRPESSTGRQPSPQVEPLTPVEQEEVTMANAPGTPFTFDPEWHGPLDHNPSFDIPTTVRFFLNNVEVDLRGRPLQSAAAAEMAPAATGHDNQDELSEQPSSATATVATVQNQADDTSMKSNQSSSTSSSSSLSMLSATSSSTGGECKSNLAPTSPQSMNNSQEASNNSDSSPEDLGLDGAMSLWGRGDR